VYYLVKAADLYEEDVEVGVMRGFAFLERTRYDRPQQVIEPELDMDRLRPQQLPTMGKLRGLMRWLLPSEHGRVRPPMRSIERELEEVWPSGER
jgi:hypothetical protein